MRKQRSFLLLFALLFVLIGFQAAAAQNATTLVVWDTIAPNDAGYFMMMQLNAQFQAAHPGVTVHEQSYSENYDTLTQPLTSILAQSTNAPDIVMVRPTPMAALVKAGLLLPLNPYADQYQWWSRYRMALHLRNSISDDGTQTGSGKLYGMSNLGEMVGLFYNRDVFSKLGLHVPTDWDALEADLDTIKSQGIVPIAFGGADAAARVDTYGALAHAYSDISDIDALIAHSPGASFLTEGNLDSAQTFVDWIDSGYFSPGFTKLNRVAAFGEFTTSAQGPTSAMWLADTSNSFDIAAEMGVHAGFFLLPSPIGDAVAPTVGGPGPAYVIRKSSSNADLAAQYIDFMTSSTTANTLLDAGYLPATAVDPAKLKANTLSADLVNAWNTINAADKVGFPLDWALPTLGDEIQKLAAKQIEPEQFADDLDKSYQAGK